MRRRLHADVVLLLAAAIWGLGFVFQKSAMQHIGPLLFIAARATVAGLALLPLALREHKRAGSAGPPGLWAFAAAAGSVFLVGGWLQQKGLQTATVTNASFLTALYVVITPFVVWIWTGIAPSWIVWLAVLLSSVGTWLLGGGRLDTFSQGDLLIALSAFLWATHVVISGRAARFRQPIVFTAAQFGVLAVLAWTGAICFESIDPQRLARALPDIAYVGLLSTALTFTLLTVALQHTPPSEAAVILSIEILFAALAGYLLLGERLTGIGWVGASLMLLAILLVQLGPALMQTVTLRGRTLGALKGSQPPAKQVE